MRAVDRTFLLWALAGLALPFGLGVALTGSVLGGLTAMLWGGAVRIFLCHQFTFCINSLCHFFGRSPYTTNDESRNLAWLSPFTFGEAWHNNHHAFPSAAIYGLDRFQIDIAGIVLLGLERVGLVSDLKRPDQSQRTRRRLRTTA